VRRRIGYLPESVPLYTDLRVGAYLDFVAETKGVAAGERKKRVGEAWIAAASPTSRTG